MIYQTLLKYLYIPQLKKLEKDIGCKLVFHHIPNRYINGIMSCGMTSTFQKFGLDILKGKNHFTMGKIVEGKSSRFNKEATEYQSWLGGYTVKLASEKMFTVEDHFKLAIADQNSWLEWYGDPKPFTDASGFTPIEIDKIQLGRHSGTLYEFGTRTHIDIGLSHKTLKLNFATHTMAGLFNLYSPSLIVTSDSLIPKPSDNPYEIIDLKGFIAIFDIKPKVKAILYANGTTDTFEALREDLLNTIKSCEIVEI